MKRKTKINILGYDYKIEYPCDQRTMGHPARLLLDKHIIQMATDQIPDEEIASIIHEILEVIDDLLELGLVHETITRIETGLVQALTQNGVNLSPLLWEK